eukprot:SAG31_NODE_4872_length_2894_cov_1.862612_1_plen_31_part_10
MFTSAVFGRQAAIRPAGSIGPPPGAAAGAAA